MTSTSEYLEVDFKLYCPKCRYSDFPEKAEPCNECLAETHNLYSATPVNWKKIDPHHKETYDGGLTKEEKKYTDAIGHVFDID